MNDFSQNKREVNPLFNLGGRGLPTRPPKVEQDDEDVVLPSEPAVPTFTFGGAGDDGGARSFVLDEDETTAEEAVEESVSGSDDDGVSSLGEVVDSGAEEAFVLPDSDEGEVVEPSVPTFNFKPVNPQFDVSDGADEDVISLEGNVSDAVSPAPAFVLPSDDVEGDGDSFTVDEEVVLGDEVTDTDDITLGDVEDSSASAPAFVLPDEPVNGEGEGADVPVFSEPNFVPESVPEVDEITSLPDEVKDVEPVVPEVRKPIAAPSFGIPKPPRQMVNPLFADPEPEEDKPAEVTPKAPSVRRANPLFDYKQERPEEEERSEGGFVLDDDEDFRKVFPLRDSVDVNAVGRVKKHVPGPLMDADDDPYVKEGSGKKKKQKSVSKRGFQLQERDITLIRFLIKYQFSYVDALARLVDSTPSTIQNRMRILEEHDLVKRETLAFGATLWQARKAGISLCNMNFTERKKAISFATIPHSIGLVNLAAELEREAPEAKDVLGLEDLFGESFPVMNRFPGGIRLYGDEAAEADLTYGEMTISEREVRQAQKRYRGGRSSSEMRELVQFAVQDASAPELEEGNESMFVVYGSGGKTGEHVPDLIVTRPRNEDGSPNHFAVELEMTAKSPAEWKRILRSFRENGQMYSRIYYFTPDRPIANMIRNANEEVGLENLIIRKYTPKNKRQPFKG